MSFSQDREEVTRGARCLILLPELPASRASPRRRDREGRLEEARGLALAIGLDVVDHRFAAVRAPNPASLIGKGLVETIGIEGVVRWTRTGEEPGVGIEFLGTEGGKRLAALIERIRARDPRVVARVVKVLVVEDNPHVASFIGSGLAGSSRRSADVSFSVQTATNGQDALTLLASEHFDAMIIDVYLPVIDGAHVISQVRSRLGLRDLPVIAVSAGGDAAREVALAAGANIFIDKPMRLRQVIDTMRTLLV